MRSLHTTGKSRIALHEVHNKPGSRKYQKPGSETRWEYVTVWNYIPVVNGSDNMQCIRGDSQFFPRSHARNITRV